VELVLQKTLALFKSFKSYWDKVRFMLGIIGLCQLEERQLLGGPAVSFQELIRATAGLAEDILKLRQEDEDDNNENEDDPEDEDNLFDDDDDNEFSMVKYTESYNSPLDQYDEIVELENQLCSI